PLLKPIRRFLPTLGMIDFSPMVVVFILLFLNNFMLDLLGGLWIIAG
ncbi:TPA: YggT family protein, partial [Haemophilus influenzae]